MSDDNGGPVSRRTFIRVGVAGTAGALVLGCDPDDETDAGALDAGLDAGSDGGGSDSGVDAGPPLSPLAIPPLLPGVMMGGVRVYELEMREGTTEFFEGVSTPTAGYNGSFLGPVLALRAGEDVELRVTNSLGRITTTHWHGLHVPASADGGPHQVIADGETWAPSFTVMNAASLCWFHPHAMADPLDEVSTSHQVWMGLAGLLLVSDAESDALSLPSTYGVDDIPLILQDRRFNPDGTFLHFEDAVPDPMSMRKGGEFMVNGVITPVLDTHAQMIRLRLLGAANARLYNIALLDESDTEIEFEQIASGGGLLTAPVRLDRLEITPGERSEIVLDLSAYEGQTLRLVSKNEELEPSHYAGNFNRDEWDMRTVHVMTLRVGAATADAVTTLPGALASFARIPESDAARTRTFSLGSVTAEGGHPINGMVMDITRTDAEVPVGDTEIWEIRNVTQMAHPFHIHGAPFQVISRTGLAMDGVPDNELGWKDTVLVRAGETVRVIKRFEDFADPTLWYMFHCHILEHEDRGMMGQFKVI